MAFTKVESDRNSLIFDFSFMTIHPISWWRSLDF